MGSISGCEEELGSEQGFTKLPKARQHPEVLLAPRIQWEGTEELIDLSVQDMEQMQDVFFSARRVVEDKQLWFISSWKGQGWC